MQRWSELVQWFVCHIWSPKTRIAAWDLKMHLWSAGLMQGFSSVHFWRCGVLQCEGFKTITSHFLVFEWIKSLALSSSGWWNRFEPPSVHQPINRLKLDAWTHPILWPANTSWDSKVAKEFFLLSWAFILRSRPCMFSPETSFSTQLWFREPLKDLARFQKV